MSAMSPPVLRVAGPRDSGDLLAWRNDPETRANSRNTDTIARDSHEAWLERALADPDRRIWVAEADGRKLGTVSAARTGPDTVEVSITVAPGLRGSGVGGAMLRACVAETARTWPDRGIVATVRVENAASRRLFERCGFVAAGERDGFVTYRRAG
ncbi:N-acetyltransferase [Thalassobaculum fulvum]|uniref:N-acetyltransferase n=1 Tax=Thalassobaculum fulvum TaxID=1633335 RepID=A0A919CPY3_9PROT|nr:GNAT family N-acetyltransferase [Thalassobaculum fulvum]GHD52456.1 N-acetyltransferase [Thalassobaculum fulvum]